MEFTDEQIKFIYQIVYSCMVDYGVDWKMGDEEFNNILEEVLYKLNKVKKR